LINRFTVWWRSYSSDVDDVVCVYARAVLDGLEIKREATVV